MKNETSQLLSEIKQMALKNPDHTISIPLPKKKSELSSVLAEIKDLALRDAKDEQEFITAKEVAQQKYMQEERHKADLLEQQKIAQMYHEVDANKQKFIASHVLEDTPPTPMPLFEVPNPFFQTQMIDIRQVNKAVNRRLFDKFKFHLTAAMFFISLGIFYSTTEKPIENVKKSKITLPVKTVIAPVKRSRPLYIWPQNHVLLDNYSNVSQDAPDLTLNNLIYKSILIKEEVIEKKQDNSRVKPVRKIIKETKKFKFEVDLNKSDLK
jgi:hypothetical protein